MSHFCITYVVDDDRDVRESLRMQLKGVGIQCQIFETGDDFEAASPSLQPGCVLLDVSLPANGMGVLHHIAPHPERFCAVMISGSEGEEMAGRAVELGAIDWLEKPFAEEALLEAISKACLQIARHREA